MAEETNSQEVKKIAQEELDQLKQRNYIRARTNDLLIQEFKVYVRSLFEKYSVSLDHYINEEGNFIKSEEPQNEEKNSQETDKE